MGSLSIRGPAMTGLLFSAISPSLLYESSRLIISLQKPLIFPPCPTAASLKSAPFIKCSGKQKERIASLIRDKALKLCGTTLFAGIPAPLRTSQEFSFPFNA
jgi:hypothetical protein